MNIPYTGSIYPFLLELFDIPVPKHFVNCQLSWFMSKLPPVNQAESPECQIQIKFCQQRFEKAVVIAIYLSI